MKLYLVYGYNVIELELFKPTNVNFKKKKIVSEAPYFYKLISFPQGLACPSFINV